MDAVPARPEVLPGQIVEVGLAWGGRAGKVVGTFAIEILRSQTDGTNPVLVSRVVEFRSCRYRIHDHDGFYSPGITQLEELPGGLATEVAALLKSEIVVHPDVARYGLVQYIECPGC